MTFHEILNIRRANLSDIPSIKVVMESSFGPFVGLEMMFTKWISQDQYSVYVASFGELVIGVSTWYLKTDDDYSKYECFGPSAIEYIKGKKSAFVINLAILPTQRRQGIGNQLAMAHGEWLRKSNCDVVVGSSWVNGSEENSQHLYTKAGFKKLGESKDFLRTQLQNGAICLVCDSSLCNCNSIFYGIDAKQLEKYFQVNI